MSTTPNDGGRTSLEGPVAWLILSMLAFTVAFTTKPISEMPTGKRVKVSCMISATWPVLVVILTAETVAKNYNNP